MLGRVGLLLSQGELLYSVVSWPLRWGGGDRGDLYRWRLECLGMPGTQHYFCTYCGLGHARPHLFQVLTSEVGEDVNIQQLLSSPGTWRVGLNRSPVLQSKVSESSDSSLALDVRLEMP